MKYAAIGVDIGGGSVKCGLIDERGRILKRLVFATQPGSGRAKMLANLIAHIELLRAQASRLGRRVRGVGIGAPGPIDVEKGFVYLFPNIPGWKNTPLKKILEKKTGLKVYVDNDANAMALGEAFFGAGKGCRNGIFLTLGTGVGGGILLQGKLFHGATFSAAEIGHLVINEDGPICGCGNRGCIETYVGTEYFIRETRRMMARTRGGLLRGWLRAGEKLTPQLVARAAQAGDTLAKEVWNLTAQRLATALAGLINILNPEVIVIGGGIAQSGSVLFVPLRKSLKKKAFRIASDSVRVIPAALGVEAGLVGSAALVFAAQATQPL